MLRFRVVASALLAILTLPSHPYSAALALSNTLTIVEPGAPDTLNPLLTHTAAGVDATAPVFDSLVHINGAGIFQPDLATHWRHSSDARSWTFSLNPRARWHDGEPVTADDVAFTIQLIRDARFSASSTLGFDHIASMTIGDAHTLTITLRSAYAPFLATVGMTAILPAHVLGGLTPSQIRSYALFNRRPIGSGPYTVAEVTADGHVIEEANKDYFGTVPQIERLVFVPALSHQALVNAERADPITLLPPSLGLTPNDATLFTSITSAKLLYTPSFAWTHIDLIEHGDLANPLVRRALALATPRNRVIAQVLRGHGQPSDGDQAPGTAAYEPAVRNAYRYDPKVAHNMLRQAGFTILKNNLIGRGHTAFTINLWADKSCPSCVATSTAVAQGWRAAGVSTQLRFVSTRILFGPTGPLYDSTRFRSPQYDAVLYAWVNGPDPDDSSYWTQRSIVTHARPLGGNFTGYTNPEIDTLIARALTASNEGSRNALYRRIQRILVRDEPSIFLYWADNLSIVPRRLRGYSPNPYVSPSTWNANQWLLS